MQFSNKKFKLLCTTRKFRGLLLLCLVLLATSSYSQENRARLSQTTIDKNIHSTSQTNQFQAGNQLSQEEIQLSINQLNDHLKAIETKRVWINSAAERIVEANENGWFEQMKATEKELISRRAELNALLKKDEK
jgi:hypothetical protein